MFEVNFFSLAHFPLDLLEKFSDRNFYLILNFWNFYCLNFFFKVVSQPLPCSAFKYWQEVYTHHVDVYNSDSFLIVLTNCIFCEKFLSSLLMTLILKFWRGVYLLYAKFKLSEW